jgi:hypothetical protein
MTLGWISARSATSSACRGALVLVMVTWTMLETFRVRGDLAERSVHGLETVESVIRLPRDLFRWELRAGVDARGRARQRLRAVVP